MEHQNDPYIGTFNTLESLVDRISEVLQSPVTLEDAHHHLLAYSRHNNKNIDSARIETIVRRRVPEKVIYRLWKDGIIPKLLSTKEPLLIKSRSDIGLGTRAAISIWRNEEVLGFIWVLEVNRKIDSYSLKLLKKAADVAKSMLIQHQRKKNDVKQDLQEFFWQMLTGYKLDENQIISKALDLKITLPTSFTVGIFRFKETISEEVEKKIAYFFKTSEEVFVPFYTVEGNDVIYLAGIDSLSDQQEDTYLGNLQKYRNFTVRVESNMGEHVGIFNLNIGFGGVYNDYHYVAKSYQEAKVVIEVHTRFEGETGQIYDYQGLGIYQFLDLLLNERAQKGLENMNLKKLAEYDAQFNTQLISTLSTYLEENESSTITAAKLHIHINTLSYRLKRIYEITGIDLSKPNEKFMIYLDLKLLKWESNDNI